MTRAVARTLRKLWDADVDLPAINEANGRRIRELTLIEARVKNYLPKAMLTPRDLRDAALKRIEFALQLSGPVCIEGLTFILPVWRPLVEALQTVVAVEWRAPKEADTGWFSGAVTRTRVLSCMSPPTVVSCAAPHHEVIESLRWPRQLITSRIAKPREIALASTSTAAWDDHFLALAADTDLQLHFVHGVPALATRDGQRCAALADGRADAIAWAEDGSHVVFDRKSDVAPKYADRVSYKQQLAQYLHVTEPSEARSLT
jgi:hypothetical protein